MAIPVVTAEQMRAIDQEAASRGLPTVVLMESAGRGVAELVREITGRSPARVLVVAGKGNNGGDGLVAARYLHSWDYDVLVGLLCSGEDLKGDALTHYRVTTNYGIEVIEEVEPDELDELAMGADIIVDAILGTGIKGEVRGRARDAIHVVNGHMATVVSVDIASGIDADTGAVCGAAVEADYTLVLGAPKVGNVVYPGARYCGELRFGDIGLPPDAFDNPDIKFEMMEPMDAQIYRPARRPDMHKGDAGRVLIVAGSRGYTGAAAMAAMGALRAGAGLVYIAVPASINDVLEVKCTEAITVPLPETDAGTLSPDALGEILQWAERCDVVALGPGLSRNPETAKLVQELVPKVQQPLVIDADGLNCLADTSPTAIADRRGLTVLTPHPGELARLTGAEVEEIQSDRLGAARKAAADFGAMVLLKGAGTILAEPDGRAQVVPIATDALATGGTGDVLTGMVAAFLVTGEFAFEKVASAAYIHARAGVLAAERLGEPAAVVAGDLLDFIADAMATAE